MKWYLISMTCLFFLGLIGGLGCFSRENSNNNSAEKKSKTDENESLGSGCLGLLIFFIPALLGVVGVLSLFYWFLDKSIFLSIIFLVPITMSAVVIPMIGAMTGNLIVGSSKDS
jgi:hypothetical protein